MTDYEDLSLSTQFLLLARYGARPVIPAELVAKDFFGMTPKSFRERVASGAIPLPLVELGESQKAARGVPLSDLANYIDARIERAREELKRKI